jgi:hypothetical protein
MITRLTSTTSKGVVIMGRYDLCDMKYEIRGRIKKVLREKRVQRKRRRKRGVVITREIRKVIKRCGWPIWRE